MKRTIVLESFLDVLENYGEEWEYQKQKHPILKNKRFELAWLQHRYSRGFGKPVICVHLIENRASGFALFFTVPTELNSRHVEHDNGNRTYESVDDTVLTYQVARLIGDIMGINDDFVLDICKILCTEYSIDFISLVTFEESFRQLEQVFDSEKMPYRFIGQKICELYAGEIGHVGQDSMRIVLNDSLEEFAQTNHYNIKKLKNEIRRARRDADVEFLLFEPSLIPHADQQLMQKIIEDILHIDYHSWQKEINQPHISLYGRYNLKRTVQYLFDHQGLALELMYVDKTPVSYVLGIRAGEYIDEFWIAYHQHYHKISPGKLTLFKFIESCIQLGIKEIECGGSRHTYKTNLVSKTKPAYELNVFNRTSKGKLLYRIKNSFRQAVL